jgi:predicted glycoside hydrolase/deacetylase ChbG (UPF0249 family)
MGRIVFNADDLGLSEGVNKGIVECYQNGVVNSASLMTNTPFFEEAIVLIKKYQLENIGLHFNLTEFAPLLTTHKTLVDEHGVFFRTICDRKNVNLEEVAAELEAQYQRAVAAGVVITHFDSHHHVHMSELLKEVFLKMADKYAMPLRKVPNGYRNPVKWMQHHLLFKNHQFYTDSFSSEFYDATVSNAVLEKIIQNAKGSIEIMCHPGYVDAENGVYDLQRQLELDVLTSENLTNLLKLKTFKK